MTDPADLQKTIEELARGAAELAEHAVAYGHQHSRKSAGQMLEAADLVLRGARAAAVVHEQVTLGDLASTPENPRDRVVRSLVAGDEMSALRRRKDRLVTHAGFVAAQVDIGGTHHQLTETMDVIERMEAKIRQIMDAGAPVADNNGLDDDEGR